MRPKNNKAIEFLEKAITIIVMIGLIAPSFSSSPLFVKEVEAAATSNIRQEINILDKYLGAASGSYATSSEIITVDPARYNGATYYFEVVASTSASLAATVTLRNARTFVPVATANIPTNTTSYTVIRSSSFTAPSATTTYVVTVGNESGATKGVIAARVIVLQSATQITSTQTQIEIGNNETGKSNTTSSALNSPKYWYYDSSKWGGTNTFYAEVSFQNTQVSSSTTYSTAGTYTYRGSPGVSYVQVEAWGGGGAGFDGSTAGGGKGGGGGAYARSTTTATAGTAVTVVVGSAGTGSGGNGNDSTYNSTVVVADGGLGGTSATSGGGTGGTTANSTGQVEAQGGDGGNGNNTGDGGGGGGGAGGPAGVGNIGSAANGTIGGAGGSGNNGAGGSVGAAGNGACGNGGTGGSHATGGGGGGGGDDGCTGGPGGSPGGGGGGGETGQGNGQPGQVVLTETHGSVGVALEEDDGSFNNWTFKRQIVSNGSGVSTTTATTTRSVAFTPTTGRNYRLVASTTHASATYSIYNAKIIVDQTSPTKTEAQYLLANTSFAAGTSLQNFHAYFVPSEWTTVNTYIHEGNSASGGTSDIKLQNISGPTDITGSTITDVIQREQSSELTMPGSTATLDVVATSNNSNLYASRILVQIDHAPGPVTASTVTGGNAQVAVAWTNPTDSDYASTTVLRSTSAVTDYPVNRTNYATSTVIGSATVACVGTWAACTDTNVSNGTAYHYKIFSVDSVGNFDSGTVPTGSPVTPAAPTFDQRVYRFYENLNGTTAFGTGGVVTATGMGPLTEAGGLAANSSYIYLVGSNSSNQYRFEKRDITTGALETGFGTNGVISGNSNSGVGHAVVLDGTYMYAIAQEHNSNLAIHKRLLTTGVGDSNFGTTSNGIATTTGQVSYLGVAGIAVDGTYVYTAGKSGTSDIHIEKRLISTGELCTAAACGTAFDTDGVVKATYNGGNGNGSALAIAIDSTYMYITIDDGTGTHNAYLEKRLLSTGELCTAAACGTAFDTDGVVALGTQYPYGVRTDGTYVYISFSNGTIHKRLATTGELCTAAVCGTAFDTDGIVGQDFGWGNGLDIDSTHLYFIGYDSTPDWHIEKKLLTTGAADTSFGTSSNGVATSTTASRYTSDIDVDSTYMYVLGDDGTQGRLEKRLLSTGSLLAGGPTIGVGLAAQSTSATLTSTGQAFRMRMLLRVDTANLSSSGQNFKLQYATKSGTCDTSFTGETYADVTTATPISYYNNTSGADGDTFTADANDPTDSGRTVVTQTYEEANNFTNSAAAIPSGQDGEWDFALYDNGASGSTSYCLRVVKSDGSTLDTYTVVPEIVTAAAPNPSLEQLHYRWRNDNSTEANASFFKAEDTAIGTSDKLGKGDRKRLRLLISNSTAAATGYTYRLEHASTSCSEWMSVPTSETNGVHWVMDLSQYFLSGNATTDVSSGLSNPNGKSFTAGQILSSSNESSAITLTSSQFTELEYSVRPTSNVTIGTTYCFRLTNAGSTSNFTYTAQPQAVVSSNVTSSNGGSAGEGSGTGASISGGNNGGGGSGTSGNAGGEGNGSGGAIPGGGQGGGGGGDTGFVDPFRYFAFRITDINKKFVTIWLVTNRNVYGRQ